MVMERELFNRLVRETKGWVFATAYNIVGNRNDAEDIMQDVFMSLYDNYEKIEIKEAVYSWIKKVTINKAINASKRNVFVQVEDFVMDNIFSNHTEDNENIIYNDQMMAQLQEGLNSLTPEHRSMIMLREIDGLSYEEIAEQTGCNLGTVMSRLFYARQKIRKFLEKRK